MNELALFAGAGGGILGGHLLGWRTVCAVEWEPYPASVLLARQNDGMLPPFPVWDDVQTFDGRPWQGIVDVVSGGFPCQDISAAGGGAGIEGERSGMWKEMARVICEVRPRFVFVENSPMLTSRGLGVVLGDLAEMGFDAKWGVLGAADVGAPHQRDRMWIVAKRRDFLSHSELHGTGWGEQQSESTQETPAELAYTECEGLEGRGQVWESEIARFGGGRSLDDSSSRRHRPQEEQIRSGRDSSKHTSWWEVEPDVGRVADGVAARVDRLKAIGNGQVSEVARRAWGAL
jgi:DNA (cytosine-5)-methyltransferase 1